MQNMAPFIAMVIMRAADISLEAGKEKYRAYFIRTNLYEKYREDTETILRTDPNPIYAQCIVAE